MKSTAAPLKKYMTQIYVMIASTTVQQVKVTDIYDNSTNFWESARWTAKNELNKLFFISVRCLKLYEH